MSWLSRSSILTAPLLLLGCGQESPEVWDEVPVIEVTNPLGVARGVETVALPWSDVEQALSDFTRAKLKSGSPELEVAVVDADTGAVPLSQVSDLDDDGHPDTLLFQVGLAAGETRRFKLSTSSEATAEKVTAADLQRRTFGRFVPERSDDFAWENDLVAFRMYGPALAADVVNSGVDCWLKRVSYPIVDKWYAGNLEGKSYHEDHGEGYDPYHVGASRGCGGIAVWEGGQMFPSNVFATWKVLENGPIRTTFELTYEPWEVGGKKIEETKRISIDLGSRLARFESTFRVNGEAAPLTVAIGLSTHGGVAEATYRMKDRWLRCWEEIDGSGLGTGVVLASEPKGPVEIDEVQPDEDHMVWIAPLDSAGTITWYAGYGWERAGEITSVEEWERTLTDFAVALRAPLVVSVKK